jgi:hypothetical protein
MTVLVHRGRRSAESIEYRKAAFYCFRNSEFDREMQERILDADEQDVHFFVSLFVPNVSEVDVPSCPQGLVLTDNRSRGAFDVHPEFEGKERFIDEQ